MLQTKTYELAKETVRLCTALYPQAAIRPVVNQLLRSGTSAGANYRACLRSRSRQEFAAKINLVLEEADEAGYWCELLEDTVASNVPELRTIMGLADEVVAMSEASKFTVRSALRQKDGNPPMKPTDQV